MDDWMVELHFRDNVDNDEDEETADQG